MSETSTSLLDRLRLEPDDEAWRRLVDIYTPLIRGWLRRSATVENDADDLVQEVLTIVVRKLPGFRRQRQGSFRAWLRAITVNCLRDFLRAGRLRAPARGGSELIEMLAQLDDPASALSHVWDEEHDRHVTQQLMQHIKPDFEPTTWRAFQRLALDGSPAATVAAELGISVNAVFIAKSRVLARLRQEAEGLID